MVVQIRSKHFHDSLKVALILAPGRGFFYGIKLNELRFTE